MTWLITAKTATKNGGKVNMMSKGVGMYVCMYVFVPYSVSTCSSPNTIVLRESGKRKLGNQRTKQGHQV